MEQPFVSDSDLKHTLRTRGVFLNRNSKADTIPVLSCCLLGAREFEELADRHSIREDNPKTITRTIGWNSTKPLLDTIPNELDLSSLVGDFTNFKIIGTPAFIPIAQNRDYICYQFEIEREDYSKNWVATKSNFKGEVRVEKVMKGKAIKFTLIHTADETKDLNRKFVQRLAQHFKDYGYVDPASEIETILFSSFDNVGRIAFFRSLTDKINAPNFQFSKVTDFGLCPESSTRLPSELKWMEDTVTDFTVRGEALQNTFFIKGKDYHKYFLFYSIEGKFKFETSSATGICSIAFEFPAFATKKDVGIELEVNISSMKFDDNCIEKNKAVIKSELLEIINGYKIAQFDRYKLRHSDPAKAVPQPASTAPVQMASFLPGLE